MNTFVQDTDSSLSRRLRRWAEANPDSIVAHELLQAKNWERMVFLAQEALEYSLGDSASAAFMQLEGTPSVVEHVLFNMNDERSTPPSNGEVLWERIERKISELGFKRGDLTFHDCGREALVFRIKGVDDLLLKISEFVDQKDNPYVLNAPFKVMVRSPNSGILSPNISIALVPWLRSNESGKPIKNEQITNDPLADIKPALETPPEKGIGSDALQELLHEDGLAFVDRKSLNMRCLPSCPYFPLIIDRRAVENNGEDIRFIKPYSADAKNVIHTIYADMQTQVLQYYTRKYGRGEEGFKNVAKVCAQARGEEPKRGMAIG